MIARRRAARPTPPSTKLPSESGPRWTSVADIRARRSRSTAPRVEAIPQMPHTSRPLGGLGCRAADEEESRRNGGQPPVPAAEEAHDRGHEQGPDHRGVEDDAGRETDPELLDIRARARREHEE